MAWFSEQIAKLESLLRPPGVLTHDYTWRGWGHDFIFNPIDGGLRAHMTGWGRHLKAGDYLILPNGNDTSRYRIVSVRYLGDPPDMWSADVEFAPRPKPPEREEGT